MGYLMPDATFARGAAVANMAALTSAAAAGSTPTKAEFDKVVADLLAARTTIQALLTSLRTGSVVAS